MITIKDNQIWFIHEFQEGQPKKPSFSGELLSAYTCPTCHNILKAFFTGNFSYDLNDYKPYGIDYQFGYVPGGTYMEIKNHSCYTTTENVKECKHWEIVKKTRGVADSLEALTQELGTRTTPSDFFISKPIQGKAKFLRIVPDMLGNDNPLLMYHRDKIIGVSVDDNIDSWYTRNQEIGEIFATLITEEGKTEEDYGKVMLYPNTPIGNIQGSEKQAITQGRGKKIQIQRGQVSLLSF